jgi:class 3 adenylate cyclase/DNA-binding response OmpR family regulator
MRKHIVVAAEEAATRATLARILKTAGYAVELTGYDKRAGDLVRRGNVSAVILVPMACTRTGLQLGCELGAIVAKVVILVGSADQRIAAGRWVPQADVLLYPSEKRELLAALMENTQIRPESFQPAISPATSMVRFASWTLDLAGRVLLNDQGQEIPLTRGEFAALSAFLKSPGRVLSREYLRQFVSGRDHEPDDRSIDVLMGRLRRKIEETPERPRLIATVPGGGYKLVIRERELEWGPPPQQPKTRPGQARHIPERRQITIMACQIAGLARLSAQIDPEELQTVTSTIQKSSAELIARFHGTMVQALGDGMLVYFGYPRAREEDAESAVRAGLELIRHFGQLEIPGAKRLTARIGIATGLAVVGDLNLGGGHEPSAIGEALILARRLEAAAPDGGILIADSTYNLVGGHFECQRLKSVAADDRDAAPAWQVLDKSAAAGRFEALRRPHLPDFVGRSEELERLSRYWSKAVSGSGQIVMLTGEAGIGKSRLVVELEQRLGADQHAQLKYYGLPRQVETPMSALLDEVQRGAGFTVRNSPSQKWRKLRTLLELRRQPAGESMAVLGELLGLPTEAEGSTTQLSPQARKSRAFSALLARIERLAARRPLLIVCEDIQWIDATSLEFLTLLIERAAGLPILIVAVGRPEFVPPWPDHSHVTTLSLSRLSRSDSEVLVDRLAEGRVLPHHFKDQILARSDGVPLFIEEVTKSVLQAGPTDKVHDRSEAAITMDIPKTLHALLQERIDRLGSAKTVAQQGAAVGREFTYEFLRMITDASEAQTVEALDRLVASGLVFRRGQYPQASFVFKHALVRDAAYGMLLRAGRQKLHARIAQALEDRFPEIVQQQPELLAYHCAKAGMTAKAVEYLLAAARRALLRSGSSETRAHIVTAQSLVSTLPETPQRSQLELELEFTAGRISTALRSYAAPETLETHRRARRLCEVLDNQAWLPLAILGQWTSAWSASNHRLATKHARELHACGERNRAAAVLGVAHMASGMTLTLLGKLTEARGHLEQAGRIDQFALPSRPPFLFPNAYGRISSMTFLHDCLLLLGYPDQAEPLVKQADDIVKAGQAEASDQFYFQSLAQNHVLRMHVFRRDAGKVAALGSALLLLAREHNYPYFIGTSQIYIGWALVQDKNVAAGLDLCQQGMTLLRRIGATCWLPHHGALLAECYAAAGDLTRSHEVIAGAQAHASETGAKVWDSELHRLRGRLLMRVRGSASEIETCFREALTTARRQRARLLELRAATSFADWLAQNGRRAQAREILVPIYQSFSERADCVDVREAKELLGAVADSPAA